ncbi:uncharacterized protein I206_103367 [Kwoniella pini CBS 10737]|uniref:Uncharacterized protein n=1 Tax=Kwoniella pini CBS 10737 TaxID=1296096 RepID=A0AAJ8MPZ9_9TREE
MLQSASEILSTTWSAVEVSDIKCKLLSKEGEENASKLCVTLFLPALLFSEIGPLSSWENLQQLFQIISWIFGTVGVVAFGMPRWIISLGKNGTLSPLTKGDELDGVLDRGQVYLLINALVANLTRFSLGPIMMKRHPLDVPHPWSHSESPHAVKKVKEVLSGGYPEIEPYSDDENAPLLDQAREGGKKGWKILKIVKNCLAGFMNPPMYGGIAAILAGVIPFLHNWLFTKGAWLSPTKNGSRPPIFPLMYLFVIRFAVMPVISISMVYGVRKALGDRILSDPVLIVEMSDTDENVETAVAKTIVISYALSPLISFSVTAALHVVQKLY